MDGYPGRRANITGTGYKISDPKLLEEDTETADNFRRSVRAVRVDAAQKLLDLNKAEQVEQQSSHHSESSSVRSVCSSVKLQCLELPKFSGKAVILGPVCSPS